MSGYVITMTEEVPCTIALVDVATGMVAHELIAYIQPMPLWLSSRSELWVADIVLDGEREVSRLTSYRVTSDGLVSDAEPIILPDRIGYTLFLMGMNVSRDEQFLYYVKRRDCDAGVWCDDYWIGIVDLADRREVGVTSLPRNAGFALLTPVGASDMLVMCPETAAVFEISASAARTLRATFQRPLHESPKSGPRLAWPVFAGRYHSSGYYMIFDEGSVATQEAEATRLLRRTLHVGNGARFTGLQRWQLDDGRVMLGFGHGDGQLLGAVIVDVEHLEEIDVLTVPPGTTSLAPLRTGKLAALHSDVLTTIDLRADGVIMSSVGVPLKRPLLVAGI